MSKTKRKYYSGTFKAKVGLDALIGIKTVEQIAWEYQVHPVQVTPWKGVLRTHLPELFEPAPSANEDRPELVAQLHEKIGQLTVEVDWSKKCHNWACKGPALTG
jgi:transposase-like protein